MGKLTQAASDLDALFRAWRDVRLQTRDSSWPPIAAEREAIEASPIRELSAIQSQLRNGSYRFSAKWGYAKRKSGGSRRGITVHNIRDRIVQRAILDVLQSPDPAIRRQLGSVPDVLDTPASFAGVPGRGVPEAVAMASRLIREGENGRAFALSDMKDFFPCVPRGDAVAFLEANLQDAEFVNLFRDALKTELRNPEEVSEWLDLFPLGEIGVAQGSLLSVLVGNLSLRRFDRQLNDGGLTTIRYLDDFAIFGPDLIEVAGGFQIAKEELARLGMSCYEPGDGSQKAFTGWTADGLDFLGCRIHPDGVAPGRSAKRKLLRDIAKVISQGKRRIRELGEPTSRRRAEPAYVQTLAMIDKKIRGWGDAFRFATNRLAFAQLDREIDRMLAEFREWFAQRHRQADARSKRRMTGVALLSDTPPQSLDAPKK